MVLANGAGDADRLALMASKDAAKKNAAFESISAMVRSGDKLGIGTGTTARYLVQAIKDKYASGALKDLVLVPTSVQIRHQIIEANLPLSDLDRTPKLDLCIDGADEIDSQLNCIKGGGGCLTMEKIVMSCADRFILVADWSKKSVTLGDKQSFLPIEVLPVAVKPIQMKIQKEFGGKCVVREATQKAGPLVTDMGGYILDWHFPTDRHFAEDWKALNTKLMLIPGVVETGLFLGVAERVFYGQADSTVTQELLKG